MQELEKKIEYKFKNPKLLKKALTHSSFSNEIGGESYERLEFLGDSILGFITAEYLYDKFKDLSEGELTRLRAALVREKTLTKFSDSLNVGNFLKLSFGEQRGGGRKRASILADVFEAIVAAIYLDSGFDFAREFVIKFISRELSNPDVNFFKDYKSEIQEFIQFNNGGELNYILVNSTGPDHDKTFTTELKIDGITVSSGIAKSKKESEQEAAKIAYKILVEKND